MANCGLIGTNIDFSLLAKKQEDSKSALMLKRDANNHEDQMTACLIAFKTTFEMPFSFYFRTVPREHCADVQKEV